MEDFIRHIVESAGVWGPVVVVIYTIASHVFAPLVGSPVFFLSIALYGMAAAAILHYVASMISASINFAISRYLGRRWIVKLSGQKTLNKVDQLTKKSGDKMLIFSRLFGFALFDFVSYAAGLTSISFKRYMLITAVFAVIPLSFFAIVFRNIDPSIGNWLGIVSIIILFGSVFSWIVSKWVKR